MIKQNDPRRWQERADMRQISEDHAAMANLSPQFINRQVTHHYPVYGPGSRPYGGDAQDGMMMAFFEGVKGKR